MMGLGEVLDYSVGSWHVENYCNVVIFDSELKKYADDLGNE